MHHKQLVLVAIALWDKPDFCHLQRSAVMFERNDETAFKHACVWQQLALLHLMTQILAIQTVYFLLLGFFKVILPSARIICIKGFDDELARRDHFTPKSFIGVWAKELIKWKKQQLLWGRWCCRRSRVRIADERSGQGEERISFFRRR